MNPPSEPSETSETSADDALRDVALAAAREAGALHREGAGTLDPSEWSEKGTADFVTEVDRESERIISRRLGEAFPDHRILGEEGTDGAMAAAGSEAGFLWIIDPLDGTTNWLHAYPEYAVSIAGLDEGGLRVGVVLNSATGEEFDAIRGRGARRDGSPIRVSEVSTLEHALIGTGFPFKRPELIPVYLRVLGRMLRRTSGVRRAGSAALDLCDLACGRLDAFWEHWLMVWDIAAGALIVREAGGTFGPLTGAASPDLAAAGEEAARMVRAFERGSLPADCRGGAFVAGNGRVDAALRRVLAAELESPEASDEPGDGGRSEPSSAPS